ncbi:MAG: hypothetical protein E4H23_08260 [Chrysiogenales bacterium]|nr:MAG: hypothetical protein E4H23_08260 [Chrysiogenales bacterium]
MRETKNTVKQTVAVKVTLNKGLVQCEPCCAYVRRGQTIDWGSAKDKSFAIHLGYDSPFAIVHHQSTRQQHLLLKIAKDIPYGRYKYTIALFDGIRVWIEDPEFIVRR